MTVGVPSGASGRRAVARSADRSLRRSKGRCPPEGSYLAQASSGVSGESDSQRELRRATELAEQQVRLKREAAGRRER